MPTPAISDSDVGVILEEDSDGTLRLQRLNVSRVVELLKAVVHFRERSARHALLFNQVSLLLPQAEKDPESLKIGQLTHIFGRRQGCGIK